MRLERTSGFLHTSFVHSSLFVVVVHSSFILSNIPWNKTKLSEIFLGKIQRQIELTSSLSDITGNYQERRKDIDFFSC